MSSARIAVFVFPLLLAATTATAAPIGAGDAEAAAIREAKERGFRAFAVRELELERGVWEVEGRATDTAGVEQRLKVKVDASTGAIVRAPGNAGAAGEPVGGEEAENLARAALEERGYRNFELRKLEREDGAWEISGAVTFPSGVAGRVKVKVAPATGKVLEVKERAAKKKRR